MKSRRYIQGGPIKISNFWVTIKSKRRPAKKL